MVTRPDQRERTADAWLAHAGEALGALAEAGVGIAAAESLTAALSLLAEALARATGAEAAVVRVAEGGGEHLHACGVAGTSPAVAAELEGTRLRVSDASRSEIDDLADAPETVARAARRVHATAVLQLPVSVGADLVGTIELLRAGTPFSTAERSIARLASAQAALAIRALGDRGVPGGPLDDDARLSLAGEALMAGADGSQTAEHVVRVAGEATGAAGGLMWRAGEGRPPPVGALQLLFSAGSGPSEEELARLAIFGVRAAHALRESNRSRTRALELERTRALLAVVGQAIAQLSLAHTLETAVARVAELLDADRLAGYLLGGGGVFAAAGGGPGRAPRRLAQG